MGLFYRYKHSITHYLVSLMAFHIPNAADSKMKDRLRTAQEVSLSLFYCSVLCHERPWIADAGSLAV